MANAHGALVSEEPYLRVYAGIPLNAPSGDSSGALCIVDSRPTPLPYSVGLVG
jgi:two-component system, cell cycle sensor histidine kinase and response regulator CckA